MNAAEKLLVIGIAGGAVAGAVLLKGSSFQLKVNGDPNSVTVATNATLDITVAGASPNATGGQSLQFYFETKCGTPLGPPSFSAPTDAKGNASVSETLSGPPTTFYIQAFDVLLGYSNCVQVNT